MGEEVTLEKHTVGVRKVLGRLVLAVRPAHAQVEIRELFIFGVMIVRESINVIGLKINHCLVFRIVFLQRLYLYIYTGIFHGFDFLNCGSVRCN